MTSAQHAAWIRRGSPWRLARPLLALRDRLRGYGYTVYDIGNTSHLDHIPPEHHAPYSEVNWPSYIDRPMPDVVTAIDIMPPGGGGLPSLQQLGAQLFADRQAGDASAAWIVDMNWGPVDNNHAVRDIWRPSHVRGSSGDTGHIHLSCRSDAIDSPAGDTYDPVARLRGQQEDDMNLSDPSPWEKQFTVEAWDGDLWLGGTVGNQLQYVREGVHFTRKMVLGLTDQVAALGAGLKAIAERVDVDPAELAAIEEAARRGAASAAVDVHALASALAPLLGVDQAVVVGALESPEGQAALTAAANRAEDS